MIASVSEIISRMEKKKPALKEKPFVKKDLSFP